MEGGALPSGTLRALRWSCDPWAGKVMEIRRLFTHRRIRRFTFWDLPSHKVGAELCALTCCPSRFWSSERGFLPLIPPALLPRPSSPTLSPLQVLLVSSGPSPCLFIILVPFSFLSLSSCLVVLFLGNFDVLPEQETNLALILASDLGRN